MVNVVRVLARNHEGLPVSLEADADAASKEASLERAARGSARVKRNGGGSKMETVGDYIWGAKAMVVFMGRQARISYTDTHV